MEFSNGEGAKDRDVVKGTRDGEATRIVRLSRVYPSAMHRVWGSLTDPEMIGQWFGDVSGDLKHGGHFQIKDNACGDIVCSKRSAEFSLTWRFGESTSWVTITVDKQDHGAHLTLEHELPVGDVNDTHWRQFGPGATGVGWDLAFLGLDMHLSSEGRFSRDVGAAWIKTDEGKARLRDWSDAWCDAHMKAGADPDNARDSANRTARFYAGED